MPTYVIVNRPSANHRPSSEMAKRWEDWFAQLGTRLVDRGNPVFHREVLGPADTSTVLGGYTVIGAEDLSAAVRLAESCPILADGGAVEVGELTILNLGTRPATSATA
jgi:hypothetical protein